MDGSIDITSDSESKLADGATVCRHWSLVSPFSQAKIKAESAFRSKSAYNVPFP